MERGEVIKRGGGVIMLTLILCYTPPMWGGNYSGSGRCRGMALMGKGMQAGRKGSVGLCVREGWWGGVRGVAALHAWW